MSNDNTSWPAPRRAAVATADSDTIYVFGGCLSGDGDDAETANDLWAFDPQTQVWTLLSPQQPDFGYDKHEVPGTRRYASIDYHDGSLYVFGGCGDDDQYFMLNDLWRFDLSSRQWMNLEPHNPTYDTASDRPPVRYTHRTTVWEDSLYVFSGWYRHHETHERCCLNDLWRYDIESGAWNLLHDTDPEATYDGSSMIPGPRYGAMAGRIGSQFYLWGGWSEFQDHNDLWSYDLSSDSWTCIYGDRDTDTVPAPRYRGSIDVVDQQLLLATGRSRSDPTIRYADIWKFDPPTKNWIRVQNAAPEHGGPSYFGKNAHAAIDGTVYYFAGERHTESDYPGMGHSEAIWAYDVSNDSWRLHFPE